MPSPKTPISPIQQNAPDHRQYAITALDPLLKPVDLKLIQATVRAYVQEHQTAIRLEAMPILEAQSSGVAEVTFELTTLFQLLSWKRLADAERYVMSDEHIRQLFDDTLSSEHAREVGTRLNSVLGWYGTADDESVDPQIVRQLVWKALILEIDPPESRKAGVIAGYTFARPENWGKPLSMIQEEFESLLSWKIYDVQGRRSRNSARLAARILAPLAPEMAVRGTPEALRYGTSVWVNFAHGVALAEVLDPGSSQALGYEQLLSIPVKLSGLATDRERDIIIETRLAPTLQWALANDVLPPRDSLIYSSSEIETATAALDEHQRRMVSSMDTLLRKVPDRAEIGSSKFNEVMGIENEYLQRLIMRPTTSGKRIEYAFRNPSPHIRPGNFHLLDVFVAGFMKEGMDKFEPDLLSRDRSDGLASKIERLKGVDIIELYEEAFTAYAREAEAAYTCLIEMLIAELPFSDRLAFEYGRVDVYLLQSETGIDINKETPRDRQLRQGRMGFILVCRYASNTFAYEVFPMLGILKRRTDLPPLPSGGLIKPVPGGIQRGAVRLLLDWQAYETPKKPQLNAASNVIPVHIGHVLPIDLPVAPSVSPLSTSRLKSLAAGIARKNLYFDEETQRQLHRHQTGSEFVSDNYPPVLRMLAIFVPGLTCFNAIQNDEAPVLACAIDIGLILAAPAFRFFKGAMTLISKAGTPVVGSRLPALAALTNKFFASSAASYRSGLNPFEGFFFRGGRTAGMSALLIRAAYKAHEAAGQQLGMPGEFAYFNGLESAAAPNKWRPIAIGDRLATINDVPYVPVREFPADEGGVRSYLINTASGNPYGPVLERGQLMTAANEPG